MASTSSSTPAAEVVEERGRKRKRAESTAEAGTQQPSKWRTRREHEIYSSKLLEAIRLVRAAGPSTSSAAATGAAAAAGPSRGSRAVREAADRALACAAHGRTHWSRAILAASHRRRVQAVRRARLRAPTTPPPSRHDAASAAPGGQGSSTPPLARKARLLGRLVPGGRKLSFPTLLEETTDYIKALEMQVRAMAALAEALSAISGTSSSSSSGAGSSSSSPA